MSQRRLNSSIQKRPSKLLKQRTLSKTSTSSTGRAIEKQRNLSQTSNQTSVDRKSRTSSILDQTKMTPSHTRNKKRSSISSSHGKKSVTIEQDTEQQKQMLIEKLLESKILDDDAYTSHNMKLSLKSSKATPNKSSKEGSNSPSPKKRSLSAFSTDYRPPSVKPSIFLTREKDSKSDSSLHKEIIEETVHYFNTPSTSAEEVRPYSAPARDFKSLEDNGYARYLLDKIRNRALRFEPQMQKIREASVSAYERSLFQKNQESLIGDSTEQKNATTHSRVMSECYHMLPRLVSKEILNTSEIDKLLPEWCIPEHHKHTIKEVVDNKGRTVSFKRSDKKEGFKRTKGARVECCKSAGTSKDWSHTEHRSRSSSFPTISTSSTGKMTSTTARLKTKPSTPFGPLYRSSEDDLASDLKNKKKFESESSGQHSLKEAWSMPAISTHAMTTTDDESPALSSQEETASLDSTSSHDGHGVAKSGKKGSLESSKETEDLGHYRRSPSRSASRSPRNRRPLEESPSKGDFLPQVAGTRNSTRSSSRVSSSAHKGSRRNAPRGEINTSGELTFTGTFDGTATMSDDRNVTEMFGYDFHVLPSTSASSSPSSSSNYDYKYYRNLSDRSSQKFMSGHDKHRPTTGLEVEDLELPAVRATRPKTAVGSSRSASTKQVAFEVSESDEPGSTCSNTRKSGRESSSGSCQSGLAPLNYSRSSITAKPEPVSPYGLTTHQRNNLSESPKQRLSLPHDYPSKSPASHSPNEPESSPDEIQTAYIPGCCRGKADALSMPSRDYIEHYSQLQVWRQERIIRDIHREITRRYGKHIHFVHPSRDFMMGIFNKSVTKHWTFMDVFQEVEQYWIKPVLNWHRRLYIYSLVYPPH